MEEVAGGVHLDLLNGRKTVNASKGSEGRIDFNAEWPYSCNKNWESFEGGFK